MSLHLTYVAVMAEMFCARAPAPVVGEHAHGAMHLNGPPLRTDAHGWAVGVVGYVLSRSGGAVRPPGADADGATAVGLGSRSASATSGTELKPRVSMTRAASLGTEHTTALLAAAPDAGMHTHGGDDEEASCAGNGCVPHTMPEHANGFLRMMRIVRDRLLHNPMVLGAVAVRFPCARCQVHSAHASAPLTGRHYDAGGQGEGPKSQAALRACAGCYACTCGHADTPKSTPPQILDTTSLYLNNCVLGISLFNFGTFDAARFLAYG